MAHGIAGLTANTPPQNTSESVDAHPMKAGFEKRVCGERWHSRKSRPATIPITKAGKCIKGLYWKTSSSKKLGVSLKELFQAPAETPRKQRLTPIENAQAAN